MFQIIKLLCSADLQITNKLLSSKLRNLNYWNFKLHVVCLALVVLLYIFHKNVYSCIYKSKNVEITRNKNSVVSKREARSSARP